MLKEVINNALLYGSHTNMYRTFDCTRNSRNCTANVIFKETIPGIFEPLDWKYKTKTFSCPLRYVLCTSFF